MAVACLGQWDLKDSSDYLGIFMVDYGDSAFEGGYLYQLADHADSDSLPLRMCFSPTWDQASVSFRFTHNDCEVFSGQVLWMGCGRIAVPDTFAEATLFPGAQTIAPMPVSVKYFYHEPTDSTYGVDFAWDRIGRLSLLQALLTRRHSVGMYLYPPSAGPFDPSVAKVIVFVYASGSNIPSAIRTRNRYHADIRHRPMIRRNSVVIGSRDLQTTLLGKRVPSQTKW